MEFAAVIDYARPSPFELKDKLVELATECTKQHARLMLDAGRGNPDWLALEARQAFFALGEFALGEFALGEFHSEIGASA